MALPFSPFSIRKRWRDFRFIWRKELRAVFADQGVWIFFIVVPLLYPLLYASFYNKENVHEAKLVFVDESRSSLSREYIRRVDASPEVQVVAVVPTLEEAREWLLRKKAYGMTLIPSQFTHDLAAGTQTSLTLYSDLSSILYYKCFMMAMNDVSLEMGRELTAAKHFGSSNEATNIQVRPVQSEYVTYFNPQSGFASFLLPAILILILQQTMTLGVCMLAGTAREENDTHTLMPPVTMRHYGGPLRVVLGKSMAYITIYSINCLWALIAVPYFLRLPQLIQWSDMIIFMVPFLLACTFFALSLSLFVQRREDTMIYIVFTSVIYLFLTGVSWPLHAIPPFWRAFSYLIPSTPGAQGFLALNGMGASLTEVEVQYKTLWVQAAFYFAFASFGYYKQFRKTNRNSNP